MKRLSTFPYRVAHGLCIANGIRDFENWAGLQSIAMVIWTRIMGEKEAGMCATISPVCLAMQDEFYRWFTNTGLLKMNCIGVLDVALNEDHSRVCKEQAPENLAVLRHIALNLPKQEKTAKGGIHTKELQAT